MSYGDNAVAAAINAAHAKLIKGGWKFSTTDIGVHAKAILDVIYNKTGENK